MTESEESENSRNNVTLTLSGKAMEELSVVARWKKIPLATFLRQILEKEHESPGFASLYRRAKEGQCDAE